MSVRKVLENFLEHVKKLEAAEEEGGKGNFSREFQYLKKKSGIYLRDGTYPAKEGEKKINRAKNRYKDILPFDYTRVSLNPINGEEGSDYINANFLKGVTGHPAYIAAQGPLPGTVTDLWRMIWQYDVKIVVMASNEYEAGKHKCQRYWPIKDEEKHFLDMKVTLVEEESHNEFVMRKINVEKEDENRTVLQFHYTSWPDHGVPSSTRPMLDMIALVREYQSVHEPPIVVHCSAGCGRTGTICAIDYAWNLLKTGKLTGNFSIYKIISEMRRQRPSIVQAKDQYVIAHKAVSELFERHLDMMNQHLYENVEFKGQPLSPGGESPSSDTGQIPYDSSYEDLAGPTSPIVRIELAPPAKPFKKRTVIVENATSPTHKAVKSTVAQIIKSESDNDLKAGTSQLTCATPTLETKFSFELEDLDSNVPSSPTKITVTDGDSLVPESSKSDMLSCSSHSAESGCSSNVSGVQQGTVPPSGEELELSSHITNIHISNKEDSQVSYQQQYTFQDKTVTQVFDNPQNLFRQDKGHLSPLRGVTSPRVVRLPGSHELETSTDDIDMSVPGAGEGSDAEVDDVVFEDNPVYSASSRSDDQLRNVPTNMDGVKNSHITTTSPKKIQDIVSELNRSISEESAHNLFSNKTHSKTSPVKMAPKPAERRKLSGKQQGFDEGDYVDVEPPKPHGNNIGYKGGNQEQSEYVYAEAYGETDGIIRPSTCPGPSAYTYVDPNEARNPLQAAAQKILTESQQNEHSSGSAGAKPKTLHHGAQPGGKKVPIKVPAKPPRKPKPSTQSTNVFNKDYEDIEVQEGVYEPVTVQNTSMGLSKSSHHDHSEDGHRLLPAGLRRTDAGSSGSSAEDVYATVGAKPHTSAISQESTDSDEAPVVPPKTARTYESSSEESITNQLPDIPDDLIKSTAGAVRTLGRVFKKKVQQAFGGNTWPLPNDKTATTPAVVIFKDKDISYGNRVSRPSGPRNTSNFTPMPAPRFK